MTHTWTDWMPVLIGQGSLYSEGVTQSKPRVVRPWRTTLGLVGSRGSTLKELHRMAVGHSCGTLSGFGRSIHPVPRVARLRRATLACAAKRFQRNYSPEP